MASDAELTKILTVASQAFNNYDLTDEAITVYHKILGHFPADILEAATLQTIAEPGRAFFPAPGEIHKTILELRRLADDAPSAFEAWQQVATAARGSYADAWHDRIDQAVMQLMGASTPGQAMRLLGRATTDEMISHRARFIELYDRMEGKSRTEQAMLPEVREAARRILSGQHVALEDRREE